jgi:hypothetical protein
MLLVVSRMPWHEQARACVVRRTAEGLSKPEIIRCPKRFVARGVYCLLLASTAGSGVVKEPRQTVFALRAFTAPAAAGGDPIGVGKESGSGRARCTGSAPAVPWPFVP